MKDLIYLFNYQDTYIVLDINSNSVFEVDEMAFRALHLTQENISRLTIEKKLLEVYGSDKKADITETLTEIEQLRVKGYIFTENPHTFSFNNIQQDYQSKQIDMGESVIKAMCLHIAHDCNLRCRYCFAGGGDFGGDKSLLDIETAQVAIDFLIKKSGKRRNIEIDFFGGEPLINFDVVIKATEYAKQQANIHSKKLMLTLTTNGTLLDEQIIEFLDEHEIALVLSLDGRRQINDYMRPTYDKSSCYDKVIPIYQKIAERRNAGGYYIRGTYTGFNSDFTEDVIHIRDLGFKYISVEPVVAGVGKSYAITEANIEKIKEEYQRLAKEYLASKGTEREFEFFHFKLDLTGGPCISKRLSGCGAGHQYIAVAPDGSVYPCHQFVGMDEWRMGDVRTGLDQIEMAEQLRRAHVYAKPECRTCWVRYMCAGGCHANAWSFNQDVTKPYQLACEITKARLEAALYCKVIESR